MNTPDPLIALSLAVIASLVLAVLFWPRSGLLARWQAQYRRGKRILQEDALKYLQKQGLRGQPASTRSLAAALKVPAGRALKLLGELQDRQLVNLEGGAIVLTSEGQEAALHIIRAHRLWEQFLAEETGFPEEEWHAQAERVEHQLTPEGTQALASQLGHPTHDPHGDPIPTKTGELPSLGGVALSALPAGQSGRIAHLSDEPETVAAQLRAENLAPDMIAYVVENTAQRIRFWANGGEHVLAPLVARHIKVLPIQAPAARPEHETDLGQLRPGERGQVTGISPRCRGAQRRRLMDLGILPGTTIEVDFESPSGDTQAYRIRGALIALRDEQAQWILVHKIEAPQKQTNELPA